MTAKRQPVYGVIMAGGRGTRFWPLSREGKPKQFLCLDGKASLLQHTARRLVGLVGWQRLLVVTDRRYGRRVRAQLPQLPSANVLLEPEGRSTLPCLLLAAATIRQREPEATMVAVPADHLVRPVSRWRMTVRKAARLAQKEGVLVTLGVTPTRPETGYGYIECGEQLTEKLLGTEGYWVQRFREKPDEKTARRFLQSGRFLWNSGMFVWRVEVFWQATARVAKQVTSLFDRAFQEGRRPSSGALVSLYRRLPAVSVDHGVLEPISLVGSPRLAVLKSSFDWSDVGSWAELTLFGRAGSNGNKARGLVLALNSANNLVWNPTRLVALVGIADAVVVDTPDALLVCRKREAQAIRHVVELLRQKGWTRYL